jgi:cytoskeleton protein RodZ
VNIEVSNSEETTDLEELTGPGENLRQGRELKGLTQEDVASRLGLKPHIVKALEENDYNELPAAIYATGYIRNYAKLIGLSADELVERYKAISGNAEDLPEFLPPERHDKVSRKWSFQKWLIPVVVIGAGLVIASLYIDDNDSISEDDTQPAFVASEKEQIVEMETPVTEEEVSETAPEKIVINEPEPLSVEPQIEQILEEPMGVEIIVHYEADSWTEIKDAEDKRIAYNLYKAGTTKRISGMAPIKILIGNARSVSLEYEGQAYDLARHIRNDTARFTLGKADDNRPLN